MSRFLNPFPQFSQLTNGALQPVSDGRLYFYVNGTSTLATIYTNAALTIPASNYQTLDSEGRMTQNVFINTDTFRIRLADSNNATIWDKSDVTVADVSNVEGLIAQIEALIASVSEGMFSNNYVENGGMQIDTLLTSGTPISLSTAYQTSVDDMLAAVLSNVTAGTVTQSTTQVGLSGFSLKFANVSCTSAGVPALQFRILHDDAISLSNKTLTISLVVKHDIGSAVNYTIATNVANAQDNFAAVTTTGISSVTSVTSGAATTISVTGAFGDVTNGLQVIVSCAPNQALTTKNFYWSDVQVSISPVVVPFRPMLYREAYLLQQPNVSTLLKVRKVSVTTSTAAQSLVADIPTDGTIPQNTEGTEVFSVAFTPTAADSIIVVEAVLFAASANSVVVAAMFKDATAGAVVGNIVGSAAIDTPPPVTLAYKEVSGSTTARTYKVRAGASSGGFNVYINRVAASATPIGAGMLSSSMTITEYAP